MKKLFALLSLSFLFACDPVHVEIADACNVQLNENDCVTIGNNVLMFSDELGNHECVWKGGACVMQVKGSSTPN